MSKLVYVKRKHNITRDRSSKVSKTNSEQQLKTKKVVKSETVSKTKKKTQEEEEVEEYELTLEQYVQKFQGDAIYCMRPKEYMLMLFQLERINIVSNSIDAKYLSPEEKKERKMKREQLLLYFNGNNISTLQYSEQEKMVKQVTLTCTSESDNNDAYCSPGNVETKPMCFYINAQKIKQIKTAVTDVYCYVIIIEKHPVPKIPNNYDFHIYTKNNTDKNAHTVFTLELLAPREMNSHIQYFITKPQNIFTAKQKLRDYVTCARTVHMQDTGQNRVLIEFKQQDNKNILIYYVKLNDFASGKMRCNVDVDDECVYDRKYPLSRWAFIKSHAKYLKYDNETTPYYINFYIPRDQTQTFIIQEIAHFAISVFIKIPLLYSEDDVLAGLY